MATTIYGSVVSFTTWPFPSSPGQVYGGTVQYVYPYPRAQDVPVTHRNKVWDTVAGDWVYWETVYPDPSGLEYPGPGKGTQLVDYGVESIVFGRYMKV